MNSQQAINLLNGLEQRLDDYCELNNEGKAAFRMAITALELFGNAEQLPSAQPEPPEECERCMMEHTDEMEKLEAELAMAQPKRGKWERHYSRPNVYADLCWHCSECGYRSSDNWADKFNFCPNCGADMRGEQDEH